MQQERRAVLLGCPARTAERQSRRAGGAAVLQLADHATVALIGVPGDERDRAGDISRLVGAILEEFLITTVVIDLCNQTVELPWHTRHEFARAAVAVRSQFDLETSELAVDVRVCSDREQPSLD